MTVTLEGDDMDFINFIDEGARLGGDLGTLSAKVAEATGLVARNERTTGVEATRLLQRAIKVLDRGID